ncbi:radical SAM/SPASM domain-containing protein [Planctomycetota bacterium]
MNASPKAEPPVVCLDIQRLGLWDTLKERNRPLAFELEVTARCNNDCRHCYINLPATGSRDDGLELSTEEIARIAREAVAMGAVWCLVTGGEPLVREDFLDLYRTLKLQGLLVSVFTNACLITDEHVALFERYPPRDIEISVYGATQPTYERITRRPGSFAAFRRGLDLLAASSVPVRLKAMALHSNIHELDEIGSFCRRYTKDYYRFDPLLHLRYDGNPKRNAEIRGERLSPQQIIALESADGDRAESSRALRALSLTPTCDDLTCGRVFHCRTGLESFTVGYDGIFHLCSSLNHPGTTYDLRRGTLAEAWRNLVPAVRGMRALGGEFDQECHHCPTAAFCDWCPAHAALETGQLDRKVEYFCQVARARAAAFEEKRDTRNVKRELCGGSLSYPR